MPHSFDGRVRPAHVGLALAALSAAAAVHAQTALYVDAAAPVGGDGQHWSTALRDLQDAIFLANFRLDRSEPIQIKVAQGIYTPDSGTFNTNASFTVSSGVSLLGGFAGLASNNPDENDPSQFVSVLSGDLRHNDDPGISTRLDNSTVVVQVQSQPGILDGLTISGGLHALSQSGYGLLNLSRCTLRDNIQSDLTLEERGGYAPTISLTQALLSECTIADNYSVGFPVLQAGGAQFQRCRIAGNHFLTTNWISGTAGILIEAPCTFDACLLAANSSNASNIVVYSTGAIEFYNCTFADNHAAVGPALSSGAGSVNLYNCILSRNVSNAGPTHQITGGNLSLDSCFLDRGTADIWNNGGIIATARIVSGDPRFVSPGGPDGDSSTWADNDYRLAPGSPCIDRADTTSPAYLSTHLDFAGNAPIDDPSTPNLGLGPITYLDLGAFEFIPPTPPACRADFNNSGSLTPQDIFDFLTSWFAGAPGADFNNSGTINAQDIFDFLTAWFAGC